MKRVLGLYIPFLSTDRQQKPGRVTSKDDPPADRRQLEALAVWADSLSPIVHIEGDDTLLVDVTGCQRLFGGEPNLLHRAIEGLRAKGFHARGGIADTPGASWAIAHAHPELTLIVPPGQTPSYLAPLPVWSLRIDAKTAAALSSVGVATIEALLHLPRSSLASRFGGNLLQRIDQAFGDMPEVLTPYRPEPVLRSRFDFGTAATRIDIIQEAIHRALEPFCKELTRRVAGVCQMFVTFYCSGVDAEPGSLTRTVTLEVSLSQPTRSVTHLDSLLTVLLDRLSLPAPVDSLMLWAKHLDPLDDWQDELFVTDSRDAAALGDLLDRLAARLGGNAVVRPWPLSDHQPERSFRYVPVVGGEGTSTSRAVGFSPRGLSTSEASEAPRGLERNSLLCADVSPTKCPPAFGNPRGLKPAARLGEESTTHCGSRPLRLLPRPIEVAATALVPEGPPISFRLHGRQHAVVASLGPERIETGWWRGLHVQRDYYRVTTGAGFRCWLFRNRTTGKWFLHGWFD